MARGWAAAVLGLLAGAAAGPVARADGPHIALHATQGAYTVTLFSAPDPLVAGPAVLTLLVQNAGDGSLANATAATGAAALPGHAPVRFQLMPGGAVNRNLLGATVQLPQAGAYALTLQVAGAGAPAVFHGTLPVEANHGQRNTVLWAVFLPAVLILLFLGNQQARLQIRRARAKAPPPAAP